MRDLIITQNLTLDGVIDNDSSWFGPAAQGDDFTDVNEALMAQARASDAFLVGAPPSRRCAATGRSSSTTPRA